MNFCHQCESRFKVADVDNFYGNDICPDCGSDEVSTDGNVICRYCTEEVKQFDHSRLVGEHWEDVPARVECEECGATYCDGDELSGPTNPKYQGKAS